MADTPSPAAPTDDQGSPLPAAAEIKDTKPSSPDEDTSLACAPDQASPPQPAPDAPYKQPGFAKHVHALIKGEAKPVEGTEDLIEDLRQCAQKQDEARQALQQVTQFGQSKQAEIFGLEGQADALMKVLYRAEQARKD